MATYTSKKAYMYGTGRRKSSVARVHLFPNGTGSITVNGQKLTWMEKQADGKSCRVIVPDDQLSLAIGKEGQNARLAAKLTGCKIDIEDDGSIFIASEDIEACRAARQTIENIVFEPEVGELYYGKVSNIRSEFGAWVELAPGKDGLIKIKDLEFKRTEKVEDVLKIGDMTWVKVMNVDDRGRIDLSRKDAMREKGLM